MDFPTCMSMIGAIAGAVSAGVSITTAIQGANKEEKYVVALTAIEKACIQTEAFINRVGHVTNTDLSDLWMDCVAKVEIAWGLDDDLAHTLTAKARFWGNTDEWLNNDDKIKLVPALSELRERCEQLSSNL